MDEERLKVMIDRANEVRITQAAIQLELASYIEGSEDHDFATRRGFARQLAGVLSHTIDSGLIRGQLLSKEELPRARAFARELSRIRLYSDYQSIHEIDRVLQKAITNTMRVVLLWADQSERVYAREYREIREHEQARLREEKLQRRRIARAERALVAKPIVAKKRKKQKKETAPLCEKCHKRPIVKDNLCQPCLTWEKNKLGRA